MSKIMSVFEKLNLVEKNEPEENNISCKDNNHAQEEIQLKDLEEDNEKMEYKCLEPASEPKNTYNKVDFKQNRKLTIEEIYSSYGVENSNINTIFMLGNFIDALPESLPYDVRKKSVISIVNSSNADLTMLIDDGKKRLDVLSQFSIDYHASTNNTVEGYKKEIAELRKLINDYEKKIEVNENLLKEQDNIIKYEIDKMKSIIDFFNNGN